MIWYSHNVPTFLLCLRAMYPDRAQLKLRIIRDVATCILQDGYQRFAGTCLFHLQGRTLSHFCPEDGTEN
jgi:hypothetical protein